MKLDKQKMEQFGSTCCWCNFANLREASEKESTMDTKMHPPPHWAYIAYISRYKLPPDERRRPVVRAGEVSQQRNVQRSPGTRQAVSRLRRRPRRSAPRAVKQNADAKERASNLQKPSVNVGSLQRQECLILRVNKSVSHRRPFGFLHRVSQTGRWTRETGGFLHSPIKRQHRQKLQHLENSPNHHL